MADVGLLRILHVDDDLSFLGVARQILAQNRRFVVESVTSADEALQALSSSSFDVVVSDYDMPGKDGLVLLEELRKSGNDIPFILFTGKGREAVAVKALNLGANYYLNKYGAPETVFGELEHAIFRVVKAFQAERALKESEAKYRELINAMNETVWVIDFDGHFLDVNDAAVKMLGYSREELLSLGVKGIDKHLSSEQVETLIRLLPSADIQIFETVHTTKDGREIPVEISSTIVTYMGKKAILSIARDLTERKKTEEKLRRVNRALLTVGKSNEALIRATDVASLIQEVCRIIVKDCGYDLAWVGLVEHGEDKAVRPIAYEGFDKEYVDSLKITWDDTERGRGPTGRAIRTGKPQLCRDMKVDAAFAPWREQATKKGHASSLALPLRGEHGVIGVLNIYSREPDAFSDEEIRLLDSLARDLGYGLTTLKARAEKEKMEKDLAAAKVEWEQTFHTMPDAIAIIDANYRIMRANQTMAQKLGLEPKELVGLTCYKHMHGVDSPPEFCPHAQTMKDGKEHAAEVHLPKLGGYFMIRTSPLKDAKGRITAAVHVATDITERKKTEEILLESERKFRSLFEHSLNGVMLTKPDGTILAANPQACRMLGMTEDEIKKAGREGIVVKDEKLEAALAEREKTGRAVAELTFRRKNGTTFLAEVSSNVFKDAAGEVKTSLVMRDITECKKAEDALKQSEQRFRDFLDSLPEIVFRTDREGKITYINKTATGITGFTVTEALGRAAVEFIAPEDRKRAAQNIQRILEGEQSSGNEYKLLKKDGSTFPVLIYSKRVLDESGKPCLQGLIVNISELKKASEDLMLLNEKLSVVGGLTRHDVRNKLAAIAGQIYMFQRKMGSKAEMGGFSEKILNLIDQAGRLLDFSKAYEELGVEARCTINVEEYFNSALALFSDLQNIRVLNNLSGLTVTADSMLTKVFYNLIDNSLKHGKKVTTISAHFAKDQDKITLIYEDDGVGIPKAIKAALFERRGVHGLFLVKKIVDFYGWSITESGEVGKGAKFVITIPAASH